MKDYSQSTDNEIIRAPFTPEQVSGLTAWQSCDWVHPFTCCDHQTMTVEPKGFICPKCGNVQTWAHSFMAEGAPPNPLKALLNAIQPEV